jgi:hypothetical protein
MKKSNSRPDNGAASIAGFALLAVCLSIVLMMTAGCSSKDGKDPAPPPTPQAASDSFLPTMTAALSQGQLTLNNPWTQADLDAVNIYASISYQLTVEASEINMPDLSPPRLPGQVRPYTTLVQQYRAKLKQCEEDSTDHLTPGNFLVIYTFQDKRCYPTQTALPDNFSAPTDPESGQFLIDPVSRQLLARYGYYCGGGYPNFAPFTSKAPEPLDSVDYCCRLHDAGVWERAVPNGEGGIVDGDNQCGMAMCLSKASGSANVMAQMPDVEEARQYWYSGAALACAGIQPNNAPTPTLGP